MADWHIDGETTYHFRGKSGEILIIDDDVKRTRSLRKMMDAVEEVEKLVLDAIAEL